MSPAPAPLFTDLARAAVTSRDEDTDGSEWDQPAVFSVWTWDGETLRHRSVTLIAAGLSQDQYPDLITTIAARDHAEHKVPAYAYQFTYEGYGVIAPPADASPAVKLLHRLDAAGRTYHKRIDRLEIASSMIGDVHGRLFTATVIRNHPRGIEQSRHAPGRHPRGQLTTALMNAAAVTGQLAYGYPVPARRPEVPRG